jgi:hypothetical protein
MRRIGGAQNQFIIIDQVDQTRVARHELTDEADNALQNLDEAQLADHEPADLLEQAQLLLRALQALLQFFIAGHYIIIPNVAEPLIERDPQVHLLN